MTSRKARKVELRLVIFVDLGKTKLKMKAFVVLFFLAIIVSCDKKNFADDITLTFPESYNMTFQAFNEGVGEMGTSIIYVGHQKDSILIKYYESNGDEPPPPPNYNPDKKEKEFVARGNQLTRDLFYKSADFIKFSNKPVKFDSLHGENVQIVIRSKDTIPRYSYNYESQILKRYKAFPVFIKNISNKNIKFPNNKSLALLIKNSREKWQYISNDNAFVCGDSFWNYSYIELRPNDIIVYAINYLNGKDQGNFKILIPFGVKPEAFKMNFDRSIVDQQRNLYEIE